MLCQLIKVSGAKRAMQSFNYHRISMWVTCFNVAASRLTCHKIGGYRDQDQQISAIFNSTPVTFIDTVSITNTNGRIRYLVMALKSRSVKCGLRASSLYDRFFFLLYFQFLLVTFIPAFVISLEKGYYRNNSS